MKELIYDLIPTDRFISRGELRELTNISDRQIRHYIAELRRDRNIISLSSGKGYKRPKHTDNMTKEEIKEMYDIVKHQIAENNSRIRKIKYNMKSQIAYLKVLEKYL